MRCLLILPLILLVPVMVFAESQTVTTDRGTLEIRVSYDDDIVPREPSALLIEFINPQTQKIQEHIDYSLYVTSENRSVFGPTSLIHSSEGVIRGLKVQFPDTGEYKLDLSIVGILFQPINKETASLIIPVGIAQAQTPEPGGGCLIATAVFGSELAPHVQHLREIRDEQLMATDLGRSFMSTFNQVYYTFSPSVADMERQNPALRGLVGATIQPMLLSLHLMQYADSEEGVLAYGVTVIILNLAMYVAGPVLGLFWLSHLVRRRIFQPHSEIPNS